MDEVAAMIVSPSRPVQNPTQDMNTASQTVPIQSVSLPTYLVSEEARATVFIGGSAPVVDSSPNRCKVPGLQSTNDRWQKAFELSQNHQDHLAAHVVKIRINPSDGDEKVASTVRLNLDENPVTNTKNSYEDSGKNSDKHSRNNRCKILEKQNGVVVVCATNDLMEDHASSDSCVRINLNYKKNINEKRLLHHQKNDMVQQSVHEGLNSTSGNNSTCFCYGSLQNSFTMVESSGQCSPSDTLDSGTCSDLDGTPPSLPKKIASTVLLGGPHRAPPAAPCCTYNRTGSLASNAEDVESDDNSSIHLLGDVHATDHEAATAQCYTHKHNRTGSLSSSEAEVESDGNESIISCDSLNGRGIADIRMNGNGTGVKLENYDSKDTQSGRRVRKSGEFEILVQDNSDLRANCFHRLANSVTRVSTISLASGTSSLSGASTTPRKQSPELSESSTVFSSPMVKEYTYEERKQEQERFKKEYAHTNNYSNHNRMLCAKYVYDDDRFYKFHLNERFCDENKPSELKVNGNGESKSDDKENDEYFAGYKIPEREAIRSVKGTVRGVKNGVRAGIATFLQKPSTKNYKNRDAGKVVVYSTTMGIVRETYYACMKVKKILRTHLVKYEERDIFMSTESQTELRDRIGSATIKVPQLFIDGQYIGDADTVERLNESGELRIMIKPYKSSDACNICKTCGGYRLLPCPACNGSKRSVHRNDFTTEFVALKCMNCDEVGLVRCQNC